MAWLLARFCISGLTVLTKTMIHWTNFSIWLQIESEKEKLSAMIACGPQRIPFKDSPPEFLNTKACQERERKRAPAFLEIAADGLSQSSIRSIINCC